MEVTAPGHCPLIAFYSSPVKEHLPPTTWPGESRLVWVWGKCHFLAPGPKASVGNGSSQEVLWKLLGSLVAAQLL